VTLRRQLLWSLLLLALIPTAVLTIFTLDQLGRAIDRWYRPGVARALEAGLEIGKGSLARIEALVSSDADECAARWTGRDFTPLERRTIAADLQHAGVDFLDVYRRRADGRFERVTEVVARGVLAPATQDLGPEIDGALAQGHTLRSPLGALAGVSAARGGDVAVAGIWVQPDFFRQLESLGHGTVYYRQLGLYVDLQRRAYAILVMGVVLALVGIAIGLSHAIARAMSRPIGELADAIQRVAAGQLETRVTPGGALELRSLGDSFNTMTERLAAAREAQQQAEREAAWRDVARKLAHEFKNILTPMQLSLQLLEVQGESVAPAERAAFARSVESALREADHLKRLAEQFSQYARLPEPNLESIDLGAVTETVVHANDPTGEALRYESRGPLPVRGDRMLLARALQNLILNAREASTPGSPIEIVATSDAGRARIEVLDRGSGPPAELMDRLFEPYVSTKRRGSGLGLSLARDIVRQHGGGIRLAHREGGGARAEITLPLEPGPEARA